MDKTCHSSGTDSSSSTTTKDHYLHHLNKISHKISKPSSSSFTTRKPPFDRFTPPAPAPAPAPQQIQLQHQQHQHQHQHQPPVYNINKSDFRDVVQKLTGSPAHERFSTPPPIQPPKPQSSRLQRIRPPPLAQISNRPPPLLHDAIHSRQLQPLSPLPPFPAVAVHTAAESPISAYMRYHQSMPPPPPPTVPAMSSGNQMQYVFPPSPLPFGCLASPRSSAYPLLSPNLLSPTTAAQLGFHQFPVSPRFPVPSPGWKDF